MGRIKQSVPKRPSLLLLGLFALARWSACEMHWSPEIPCISLRELSFQCGDCIDLQIGSESASVTQIEIGKSAQSLEGAAELYFRCSECNFYVPNNKVLSSKNQVQNIGTYGCTWARPSFLTKHPLYLVIVIGGLTAAIASIMCCICVRAKRNRIKKLTEGGSYGSIPYDPNALYISPNLKRKSFQNM